MSDSFRRLRRRSVVWLALSLAVSVGYAKGRPDNPGGGGHTEPATNNLSFPAVHTADPGTTPVWNVPAGVLGEHYSLGCAIPEDTYPNTSCVELNPDGTLLRYLTAQECVKCAGQTIERIYWQKVIQNDWWAQSLGKAGSQTATYVDWADNLETVTWKTSSSIRVETTPFTTTTSQLGFQMWHVFGQGPDEVWGVRTVNSDVDVERLPYIYQSPYAIVHTSKAQLNIAKLEATARSCPVAAPPGGSGFTLSWDSETHVWIGTHLLRDIPYTAELNVGGKYVYGYNWMLRRDSVEPWNKAGWWRLTFYTPDIPGQQVIFDNADIPLTPPPAPDPPPAPGVVTLAEEGGETGPIYIPVVDTVNNLTYIDVCVAEGGGSGNGGGPGGGGGGPR